jgi:cytochrome P450
MQAIDSVADGALFNSFAAELVADPYPHYERLRQTEPVYWEPVGQTWILSAYDDVRRVLEDPTFEAVYLADTIAEFARRMKKDYGPFLKIVDAILFFQSGEIHKRNRRALTQVLTRIPLSALEPEIKKLAAAVAADLSGRTTYDAATEYADLIPSRVMIHVLGLPPSDLPLLLDLAMDFTRTFDTIPISLYDRLNGKAVTALDILTERIHQALAGGQENGLTLLSREAGTPDDPGLVDAAALAFFIFAVGTETTAALIAACIDGLLANPHIYAKAREAPALAARIVSEVVRLDGPVQRVARVAPRDLVLGNRKIRQGDRMMLLLGAANRDPCQFSKPSVLDLERQQKPDVGFGAGSHFCLGTSLARMEARIALEEFLQLPPIELSGPIVRYQNKSIRKITSLPVRVSHRSESIPC